MTGQECFGAPKHQNPPRSQITLICTAPGQGSTGTVIRTFPSATKQVNIGADITYQPNSVLGDSFLINTDGVYSMFRYDTGTVDNNIHMIGFSINSNQLTTRIDGITQANQITYFYVSTAGNNAIINLNATWLCKAGDVIRCHDTAGEFASNSTNMFTIVRVA